MDRTIIAPPRNAAAELEYQLLREFVVAALRAGLAPNPPHNVEPEADHG